MHALQGQRVFDSLVRVGDWGNIICRSSYLELEELLQNVSGFSDYDLPRRVPRHGHSFLSSLFVAVCGRGWGEW